MNKFVKGAVALDCAGALAFSFAGCAKLSYVAGGTMKFIQEIKEGTWKTNDLEKNNVGENVVVIDEFSPVTVGSVSFETQDDAVKLIILLNAIITPRRRPLLIQIPRATQKNIMHLWVRNL